MEDQHGAQVHLDLEQLVASVGQLSGLQDAAVIAAKAAREAQGLSQVDLIGIAVRENGNTLTMMGVVGETSERFAQLKIDVDVGLGFSGTILATGLALFFRPPEADRGIFAYDVKSGADTELVLGATYSRHLRERLAPEELSEYLGVPIGIGGHVYGILYAGARRRKTLAPHTRVLLARFAQMIAPALKNAMRAHRAVISEIIRERELISFKLHDTIGQILFAIGASAQRGQSVMASDAAAAAQEFGVIELETARAAAHLREILRNLGEAPSESILGFELEVLASMFSKRTGVPADVLVTGTPREVPPDVIGALTAVVREGLHNAEKHACATAVVVTLHYDLSSVAVTVQDDGIGLRRGFEIGLASHDGAKLGLVALKRRVERLGGMIAVNGRSDGGTTLKAAI